MDERELRTLIDEVKGGRLSRRRFVQTMVGLGLTAPLAAQMLASAGMSVTWRLKKNVVWHDGKPFTADDVVFNWEYVMDPGTAAVTSGQYRDIVRIDKLDGHTVKIVFKTPTPFWSAAFCGPTGM